MARARGSYPRCHWFKSSCRYHHKKRTPVRSHINGPVVKRLRLRPFTAATRVRVPSGSPPFRSTVSTWRHSSAGRALASHARGHRFEFCCLHQKTPRATTVLGVFVTPKHSEPDILASRRHRGLRSRPVSVILTLEAPDVPHETGARV